MEVKQTAFRLDGVMLPPPGREDAPLLFTEAQFQPRRAFYARWFASIFLYLYRHRVHRPWQALVVFPHPGVDPGPDPPYAALMNSGLVRRVYLKDLLDAEGLGYDQRLLRLVVLDPAAAPAAARALAANPEPPEERLEALDLIETILVYKFPTLTREEIRAMLHLPETELKKTRFYQEVFDEGREEGRAEGHEEGRKDGLQAGRTEGRRAALLEVLMALIAARFGAPTPAMCERLDQADTETLMRWSKRILTAGSLSEVLGERH